MKTISLFATVFALIVSPALADENHDIISKVMKDGLKGKTSPLARVLDGEADAEETKSLAELVRTMGGTQAPVGDQAGYDDKVAELIAALDAVAGGDTGPDAIHRLDNASSCKACHSDHKPKKKKKA